LSEDKNGVSAVSGNASRAGANDAADGSKSGGEIWQVGERIHDLRMSFGLTQEELADRSNLTKGFISQLERDLSSPSLESLVGILRALDTDIVAFFKDQDKEDFVFGDGDVISSDTYPEVAEFRLLVPGGANCNLEPALVTFEPGQEIAEPSHMGEEYGYVLEGKVAVTWGERQQTAGRGQSFYFVADRAHKLSNPFPKSAKVLWVSSPPSF
jgi:transcriptional regulator with XRE-family HTH domain